MKPITYVLAAILLANAPGALGQTEPRLAKPVSEGSAAGGPQEQVKAEPVDAAAPLVAPLTQATVQPNGLILLSDPTNQANIPLILQQAPVPAARISLDVNERIQSALAKLFNQSGLRFELDRDVPSNTRVTLRVRNVSFLTALRALLEQADLGWTVTTTIDGKEARALYRIGKQPTLLQTMPIVDPNLSPQSLRLPKGNLLMMPRKEASRSIQIEGSIPNLAGSPQTYLHLTNPTLPSDNRLLVAPVGPNGNTVQIAPSAPLLPASPNKASRNGPDATGQKVPLLGDLPIIGSLFTTRTRTERSIFTCPHCHEQATVVRSHEAPSCPECGRQFQTDWKVCPFDGAKRPANTGEWKFCPVCGKSLGEQRKTRPGKE
jgi:hypothetical protein